MAVVWDSTLRARSIVSVGDVQGPQCILTTLTLSEATELPASIKTSSHQICSFVYSLTAACFSPCSINHSPEIKASVPVDLLVLFHEAPLS